MRLMHGNHFHDSGQAPADILATLVDKGLIDSNDALALADAHMVMGNAQHALRLSTQSAQMVDDDMPPALGQFLSRWLDAPDINQVAIKLDEMRAAVREIMARL
ncbi:MAG: hypothetical protein ACPID2_01435 [Candidatus Puniceispirillum sp.]